MSVSSEREKWQKPLDFIVSCIGFAVGLGNIWRFPYLCYKNGGGAFFIPYFIMLVFGGIPIFMLEVGLGQYMSKGGLHAWDIVPLFKGIGVATTVILFLMNIYYIMIMAWAALYFVMSLTSQLPWSHCNNYWNTERCISGVNPLNGTSLNSSNITVDSTVEFWERRVLQITAGVEDGGGLVWELVISLLFVWTVVYFCVWRGIKWTGKIVYFTALFPYVILTILLIRAASLDGASNGLIYYLKPDFSRLANAQVWVDGGTQIFFSYAIALGCMISLGSYNKFNTNFIRQCGIIAVVNSGTSIFGGLIVFSLLGFMAKQQNVDVSDVVGGGPGLAFIIYPKVVTLMPLSPLWSALFFFTVFLIGIDSQFVAVEGILSNIMDSLPKRCRTSKYRMVVVLVYCLVSFLLGLSIVSRGGMYIFQLFDYYSASGMVLLFICFLECIAIGWVFGADRFYDVIELMLGYRINKLLHISIKFITPLITMGIFLFQIIKFVPLTYNKVYIYPDWAQGFGIGLAAISMVCFPVYVIVKLLKEEGSFLQRLKATTTPRLDHHQIPKKWRHDPYKYRTFLNNAPHDFYDGEFFDQTGEKGDSHIYMKSLIE